MVLVFLGILAALAIPLFSLMAYLHSLEAPQVPQPEQPAPRPGLWFCAHRAKRWIPFQHMYLKVTPRDASWAARYPDVFLRKDSMGSPFFTLGAGPLEGLLKLEFNRAYDLRDPVSFEEPCIFDTIEQENGRIASLLMCAAKYQKRLPFRSIPQLSHSGYNCNSILAAIALRSHMPMPAFTRTFMLCIGVGKPVPEKSIS